ncbi:MAG: DUF4292 domain-containing protein [Spirochaetes bacterium]|nr:DUF4292 domain-containing protein [Spirochaetota bacterium]
MALLKKDINTECHTSLKKTARHFLKLIFIAIAPLAIISVLSASADEADLSLFNEIIKANMGIISIDAEIVQYITTPDHSKEIFKGRYKADNQGRFRIDYTAPSKQTVLNNGRALYWYFPDDNILYILENGNAGRKDLKVNPLQEFLNKNLSNQFKVIYRGKHFYGFFKTAHEFIVKDNKNELNFNIRVDAKTKMLISKIITNITGQEIIKEIYENHKKIKNIFFPSTIDIYARTDKGITRNTTEYSKIRLNYSVPDSLFEKKFPENAKKKYLR